MKPSSVDPTNRAGPAAPDASVPARVHAALLLVQVAFATLAVEGKIAMGARYGVSPSALAMLRIGAGGVLFVSSHVGFRRTRRVSDVRDMVRLGGLALTGIVANQALFLMGLRRTSPVAATLLVATIPIFATVIARLAGVERLRLRGALGIALAVFGIAVLSGFALPGSGDLLVLLNAASYAIYVVFAKPMLARYGALTVLAWVFGLGSVLFMPIGGLALARDAPAWSPGAWAYVAFIVAVPTLFAYALSAWALRRATPSLVAVYIYLQPIVVVLLAWIQLGHRLTSYAAIGGIFILAGVGLVARGGHRSDLPKGSDGGRLRSGTP